MVITYYYFNANKHTKKKEIKMSKFNEWQSVKAIVKSAKSWVSNREKIDSQDGKRYMKVKKQSISLEYCGQSYAGANNYHQSPGAFDRYIAIAFDQYRDKIEDLAMEILEAECKERAILAREEVKEMLVECESE